MNIQKRLRVCKRDIMILKELIRKDKRVKRNECFLAEQERMLPILEQVVVLPTVEEQLAKSTMFDKPENT